MTPIAERLIVTEEPVVFEAPLPKSDVVSICARCEMEIAGEPVWRAGEVYRGHGCAPSTGCTCLGGG